MVMLEYPWEIPCLFISTFLSGQMSEMFNDYIWLKIK